MQVRLLGPVDVIEDGAARAVHGPRRKALLAVLALIPGEIRARVTVRDTDTNAVTGVFDSNRIVGSWPS